MSTIPAGIPPHAEMLRYSDHEKVAKGPSRYAPGVEAYRRVFCCPNCKTECEAPPVLSVTACKKCGLMMKREIVDLYVWRDEAPEAVKPKLEVVR